MKTGKTEKVQVEKEVVAIKPLGPKIEDPSHQLPECFSEKKIPILHYDKKSSDPKSLNILVFATVHGDEPSTTIVAYNWINRLKEIDPRSSWRIIPILNPDGKNLKRRTNANAVDLNRNFPTRDFDELALKYWREKKKSAKRRFPGLKGGSEAETRCAVSHIENYRPDFVIAIHAPYGILDFDGPKNLAPSFKHLRFRRLGHFPGSLGRYMWHDRGVPVLTIELKSATKVPDEKVLHELQDMAGLLALKSAKTLKK